MGLGGLFLGYVGATDSYELPLALRLGLWLGLCAIAGIIAITIEGAVAGSGLRTRNPLAWWALLTTGLAITMVPVIFLVNSTGGYSPIADLGLFTLNSFAISAALVAFRLLIGRMLSPAVAASPEPASASEPQVEEQSAAERPRLFDRLAPGLQSGRLLALKSEGHYLKVYTDQGSELILMRLKDAIAETEPVAGMQVHRSWWLARRSPIERRTTDGRIELRLDEETWVPISRNHRAAWLEQNW